MIYRLLALVVFVAPALARTKVEVFRRYTGETINGISFERQVDIKDGNIKEIWRIGAKPVTEHDFNEQILEAEREESRIERQKREDQLRLADLEEKKKQDFADRARKGITKKRMSLMVDTITQDLSKIKDPKLESYLIFEPTTFASRQELSLIEIDLVPRAKMLLESDVVESELLTCINQLEMIPDRLQGLFRSTVKNAINTCNDTKLLKDLLNVVS